jgi:hypothetical protein
MMPRLNANQTALAERHSGFHAGQRVTLSPSGERAMSIRQCRKQPGETGTIIAVLTCTSIRVRWDRFATPETLYVKYLRALEDKEDDNG